MKFYSPVVVLAAIVALSFASLSLATDRNARASRDAELGWIYQQLCRNASAIDSQTPSSRILLTANSDRGCCVWKTPKPKCAYSNKTYCVRKAKNANVEFEFYGDTTCKNVPACR